MANQGSIGRQVFNASKQRLVRVVGGGWWTAPSRGIVHLPSFRTRAIVTGWYTTPIYGIERTPNYRVAKAWWQATLPFSVRMVEKQTATIFFAFNGAVTQDAVAEDGYITGTIKDGGVVQPGVEVVLLWRPTKAVLQRVITDVNGVYTFLRLDPRQLKQYTVMAFDPPGGPANNMGRLDYMTPGPEFTVRATLIYGQAHS